LKPVVEKYQELKNVSKQLEENYELTRGSDPEMSELAEEEIPQLEELKEKIEHDLKILLLPKDPMDEKNVMLEIRAGTGGDEAGLFAADLLRMYLRFAETMRWKSEI